MEGFFRRYRNVLVLVAIVLAQTIGLATQVSRPSYGSHSDGHNVRLLRLWVSTLAAPPEKLLSRSGHGIRSIWNGYIDLRHLHKENEDLQQRLNQLRLHNAALAEDARQSERLRTLLAFQQQYISKTVAAQVIGNSGSDASHVLMLDKGSHDGLKPDMAVITPDGIVGKLRNVFPRSSELLLINDASSGAGVVLENTRIRAVMHGSSNGIAQITNLLPDTRIQPGDHLVTSGGDMVYPRGLNVGVVKSIEPDREHQPYTLITIQPAARLERLEEVLVITDLATHLPADAQSDTVDQKSTSQVLGERLPGLHDASGTETPTEVKPGTEQVTPAAHALPTVHPDKYSPGATPDASSLTPGQKHDADPVKQATPKPHQEQPE